jgi:hypothetical protein
MNEDDKTLDEMRIAAILSDFDQELDDVAHGIWPVSE